MEILTLSMALSAVAFGAIFLMARLFAKQAKEDA